MFHPQVQSFIYPEPGARDSLNDNDFVKQKAVVVTGFRDGSCCEICVLEVVGAK